MIGLGFLVSGIGLASFAGQAESTSESPVKDAKKASTTNPRDDIRGGYNGAMPARISSGATDKAGASGDRPGSQAATPLGLEVVDQTVSDRGPLDVSLRQRESGLALPTGFRMVYRLPGEDSGFGVGDRTNDRLMRANGGMAAVYEQSIYLQTEDGIMPDVPASTTWVIGGIPLASEPGHGMLLPIDPLNIGRLPVYRGNPGPQAPTWVPGERAGFRVGTRISPEDSDNPVASSDAEQPQGSGCRFLDDRAYRAARLRSLLDSTRRVLDEPPVTPADG